MEAKNPCKCRCPCHSRDDHNLIQLEPDVDRNRDGMSWAEGAIRSHPVNCGSTYPHPNSHFPFGESWATPTSIPATGNPFKTDCTPKAHEAISKSFLHVKNMVKTMTAKWETLCDAEGGKSGSKRSSSGGNKKSFDGSSYSSEQSSYSVEEPSSPAKVFVDTDNQPLSNYPLHQKNFLGDEDNAYSFHPTNPFQIDELKKVEESIPPPPPPRVPSNLLDTHSFHCCKLHARLELTNETKDCSSKQASAPSRSGEASEKDENEKINSFNTINTATTVGTSEENESVSSASSHSQSPRSSKSSSSQTIVLYPDPETKEDGEEKKAEEEEHGNRKSVDSTGDDLGHPPRYKAEKGITLERSDSPRQSLPNEVEVKVGKEDDDVDNKVEMEPQQSDDGRKNKGENCVEKKSVMDVAVQTSIRRYRTETNLTLETPEEIASPAPLKLEKFHKDDIDVDDKTSDGNGGRESHFHSTKHKDLRPSITPEMDPHPEGHQNSGRDEQQQQTLMSSSGDEHDCTYHALISIPNNGGDEEESFSCEDMEVTLGFADQNWDEERAGDERAIVPVEMQRHDHDDVMRETTQNNKVLAILSESYDNIEVTGPLIQVEPVGRSVSVTNVNQNTYCNVYTAKGRSSGGEKKKKNILTWTIRQQYFICFKCDKIIDTNATAFHLPNPSSSVAWHSHCFQCKLCAKPLSEKDHGFYEDQPYCLEHYTSFTRVHNLPTCSKCHETILDPSYTAAGGRAWHKDHFTCHGCHKPLTDTKFVLVQTTSPYCLPCHGKSFPKQCRACQRQIIAHEPFVNVAKSSSEQVFWHCSQTCLTCSTCGGSLVGRPLFFRKDNGLIYCNKYCAVH